MSLSLNFDSDFNFSGDKINRFVPFVIGFLVFSVTIALMSALFTHQLTSEWSDALNGHMTIEFQSNVIGEGEALTEKQQREVIDIVSRTPGITKVNKLEESDMLKILEPWLSCTSIPDDFPFPTIFDVESDTSTKVDLLLLTEKLSKISQGVKIHNHSNWYVPIIKISDTLFFFSILLSFLILCTVCATVIFITKYTLKSHEDVVKILQLIGANNFYIASQFKQYYFYVGLKASAISVGLSLLTLLRIFFVYPGLSWVTMLGYFMVSLLVPVAAIATLIFTSKNSVMFFLKEDKWVS